MDHSPLKKVWRADKHLSITKDKRAISKWVRKADKRSFPQKPTPGEQYTTGKELTRQGSSAGGLRYCYPILGTLAPGCAWERQAHRMSSLENQGHWHTGVPEYYRKLRFPSWRNHLQYYSPQHLAKKKVVWRVPRLYVKSEEDSFADLGASAGGEGDSWDTHRGMVESKTEFWNLFKFKLLTT